MNIFISPVLIRKYLEENFPSFKTAGDEVTIPSIFYKDSGEHLSINTESGLWQDFKSGHKGNFPQFVAYHTGLPPEYVLSKFKSALYTNANQLKEILLSEFHETVRVPTNMTTSDLSEEMKNFSMVDHTKAFKSGSCYDSVLMSKAATFLAKRKLHKIDAYVATKGVFSGRLILPFAANGRIYYFLGRALLNQKQKYFNPKETVYGVKSSDILYPYDKLSGYAIVAEGTIDAITLQLCGLNATSIQGSKLSIAQIKSLSVNSKVILAFDNDSAGSAGSFKAYLDLIKYGYTGNIYMCKPASKYKDWNDMYLHRNEAAMRSHFMTNTEPFDFRRLVIGQLT